VRFNRQSEGLACSATRAAKIARVTAPSLPLALPTDKYVILTTMDHLEVLREKIARLRFEISDIQELNEQYRFGGQKGAEADIADGRRQQRLQAIQEELVQLSQLGQRTLSMEQIREKHRSRLHLVKNAS
jgi:hypothetical protein